MKCCNIFNPYEKEYNSGRNTEDAGKFQKDGTLGRRNKISGINGGQNQQNNPLHGKTLESILVELVEQVGWIEMNRRVEINCFFSHPSIKSSLKFLRKNNWARIQVEQMYMDLIIDSNEKNNDYHM